MKKQSVLLPLTLFFSSILSIPTLGQSHRFVIKVISEDRREPIEGASIKLEAKSNAHSETRFETADWEGMGYRVFDFYGTFTVSAVATGYESSSEVVTKGRKDPSGDVPITLILKRKSGSKLVIVDVFEKGTGMVIYDAKVSLKGKNYNYSGSTNSMGEAVIRVDKGDDYVITVSHNGYETKSGNLRVKMLEDDEKQYLVNFELAATNNFKRIMYVKVQTVLSDGTIDELSSANVIFRFEGTAIEHKANAAGIVEFPHSFPPGEQVMIDVSMGKFKPQSKTITIKASGAPSKGLLGAVVAGGEKDMAVFTLVREKGTDRTLNIKVIDEKGNVVKFADVNFPDDGLKVTNAYGECSYTITWPADEPLKVSAEKKGYTTGISMASLRDDNVVIRIIKKAEERTLRVEVRDEKGNPIPYADVSFPDGNSKNTDMSGLVEYKLAAPTDGTVSLQVGKKGFKAKSAEVGPGKMLVVVVLEKEAGSKRTLHITVKDKSGQPVKFADLNFPDGQIKVTNAYGNCDYAIAWPSEQAVKIEIEKKGYHPQTVNASPGNNDITIVLEKDENTAPCRKADEELFSQLAGTWKSYRTHVTIGGSCNQVSGTWKVTEWCEGVDATNNPSVARINGTFKGKMEYGTLRVSYESPPSPNNSKGTKGTGTIYLQSNGTLSVSFGCPGDLEKNK